MTPSATDDIQLVEEPVVARLSYHVIREERLFQVAKTLISTTDPDGLHALKPIDLFRLQPAPGDRGLIVVSIWQNPGHNHLMDILDMGPAYYKAQRVGDSFVAGPSPRGKEQVSLDRFLEFAIGATQCLEILHHSLGMIHGEIRGDAFHYNADEGKVRIASFGSGMRSFEHGLTSAGWSSLSKELGAKNKLLYISPEQTGRMPAEPDSRTDIYSLGVLLWMLLAQQPVFDGDSPLDIVQGVLGRRIPNVATIRVDVPETIGRIIQKCTAKNIADRYHSASGLRTDLVQVQKFLSDGDAESVINMKIASKDVSSFFMLPATMIGRQTEKATIMKVIDRVAKSHAMSRKSPTNRFSDGSSLSNEVVVFDDVSSEGGSSAGADRRSGSFSHGADSGPPFRHSTLSDAHTVSNDTVSSNHSAHTPRLPKPWERHQSLSFDNRSLVDSVTDNRHSMADSTSTSLSKQLGSAKFRRRGQCEVITIEGAGGLGKSCLVQSVLADARRRGHCTIATAKFDTARRTAFGPLLKLLSSLFKQVWGERNTETPFHQMLKSYVRPSWPMLHRVLNLPEFLLGPPDVSVGRSLSSMHSGPSAVASSSRPTTKSLKSRRESSPGISPGARRNSAVPPQSSQEFLRSGSSTKTTRLMNVFLDVLRVFTTHKCICFCLDDLHWADEESLELISQIVGTRMKMIIIITYRPEDLTSERMHDLLVPTELDEHARASGPMVTRISLMPLAEHDIIEYVGATLCRPGDQVLPLALVIQSKSAGNPFFLREMLSACHRKQCIWYDYRESQWEYSLDLLFEQFRGEKDYDVLDTAFITQRLSELPPAARALLSWAALLGNTFSFELVARLMSGEFEYDIAEFRTHCTTSLSQKGWAERDAILGLQAAIQAYIIVPADTDDRFRFAHDRYIHASAALEECSAKPMHFVITQTMLKYYTEEDRQRDSTASHMCEAADIIKRREKDRRVYRRHLTQCGRSATERGARPTAAKFYRTAVQLLQPDPWTEGPADVSYDETLQLFLRSAECYLYMGQHKPATEYLSEIFTNAKTVLDKAPAYVLNSRIYAQSGNSDAALIALKECLSALNVPIEDEPTWKRCDERFEKLSVQLQTSDRPIFEVPEAETDPTLASIGAILSETVAAALWSDSLRFYHLTLIMVEMHLSQGFFPHSGLAFLYLAIVSISRFGMAQFAINLGEEAQKILSKGRDTFSISQDLMLHACYVGHLSYPMNKLILQMEDAVELASTAGDRMSIILSYGILCQYRFFNSDNCADLEAFCEFSCEEISDWDHDVRGGPLLIGVRQVCRALQGKTYSQDPLGILSDSQHDSESYKSWLSSLMNHSDRSTLLYESLELVPLYLYGHYDRAIQLGNRCLDKLGMMWSARNSRLVLLFHGLSLSGKLLREMQDPVTPIQDAQARIDEVIEKLQGYVKLIDDWNSASDINYLCWSRLLKAQTSELSKDHGSAVECYEEALDHATEHDFIFEEALGNYAMAGFFLRRKARRSARAALADAVGSYRLMGATGVAKAIEEEHSLLLHGPTRSHRTVDVGIQTEFTADSTTVPYRTVDGADEAELSGMQTNTVAEQRGDRIGAWRGSMNLQAETGVGLPALDMIDLHAILVSSQVISSVLNVDDLLKTMCDNILQTCGGSANLAAIVVQDDAAETDTETWCVAASGDPERGASAHRPGLSLAGTSLIVENVVLYCTRFRETVFVPDLVSDERFGNVSNSWLQRNPLGKAIIAIPISHGEDSMYGVLYLEGQPGSFTDRNVTVLQLLVNQIAISYANALAMKNLEKASAENRSMVTVQKRALEKALNAETKAKDAEAEAKRNVKLAEEAAKAKSIFLANVSHELRTPLNGVIGNSELLRDSTLAREQMEMADSIRVSADLLLTVINDILDFSKMEADKMKLYIIAFNPAEMVREVVRAVSYSNREKTSKKNVKIVQDINLPPMLIYGDPIRLHQVLGNLIGNSLKFTEDGSITIGARLDSDTKEAAVLTFWVRDTGIGIPPSQLAKLFQPFSQADASTARKYGGSGLGLSICKSLIKTMMKGKIQLESEEGVGTTAWFTVTFEKTKSDVSAGDAQATSSPPIDRYENGPSPLETIEANSAYVDLSNIPQDKIRICIAEDNPINQKIALQYVQRLGYHNVIAYENGMKAVEGLRQNANEGKPFHIVLMDVMMPVLDGYEATKLIRKDSIEAVRKILVIAMTASAIQGDREKCLAAGMNDYLAKPVRSEVLKKKLDTYLNGPVRHLCNLCWLHSN